MQNQTIKKGNLLLGMPSTYSSDQIFSRSTILLCEHDTEGSVGFILNKPLNIKIDHVVPDINASFTLFHGGPVEEDKIFYIHNRPELIPNSFHIENDLYWGGDFEVISQLIQSKKLTKNNIRFFLGYTGWGVSQLESEFKSKHWIIDFENIESQHIFLTPSLDLWKKHIEKLGEEYAIWLNAPSNPELN